MNEPQHPHFVLSDGNYCHVMPEGLIVSKKKIPDRTPAQDDKPDVISGVLLAIGVVIFTFLIVMCAITGMYVVVFLLGLVDALLVVSLIRTLGYSQTPFIPREDISGVEYIKRNFGYDVFLVHYTGKKGKHAKRRLVIYDSQECLTQALNVMVSEELLKPADGNRSTKAPAQ